MIAINVGNNSIPSLFARLEGRVQFVRSGLAELVSGVCKFELWGIVRDDI